MEKWSEERIEAYKRYVNKDIEDIGRLEQEYLRLQSAIRGTIERIQRIKSCTGNYEGELYLQGWKIEGGKWVQFYDNKGSVHEGEE